MTTPTELAGELGISPKTLRTWLRATYPRFEPGRRWELSPDQVQAARTRWDVTSSTQRPTPRTSRSRDTTDEAYVIELLDQLVGDDSARQHGFDWLLGDPNRNGKRVALPVDAFWPDQKLVAEYRERQHGESTPFFDKPAALTISGVDRGEQRRRYDRRRDELIPAHGLRLLTVTADQLVCDSRGRLRRDSEADRRVLSSLLREIGISPSDGRQQKQGTD
jgi:hypothetical protein